MFVHRMHEPVPVLTTIYREPLPVSLRRQMKCMYCKNLQDIVGPLKVPSTEIMIEEQQYTDA